MSRPEIDPLKAYLSIIAGIVALAVLAVVVFDWPVANVQLLAWDLAVPLLVLTALVLFFRDILYDLTR